MLNPLFWIQAISLAFAQIWANKSRAFLTALGIIVGVASTTAVIAALTGEPAAKVTGRGTGISKEALPAKVAVIEKSLAVNQPDAADPIDVLTKVGGRRICLDDD